MDKNILKESNYSINKAVKYLNCGKLVAIQTETVYGVACNPGNIKSIKKLYELKQRPAFNPLIIHVNSFKMVEEIAYADKFSRLVMEKFWPGPLTLILHRKKSNLIHDFAISGLETIAIRMPRSKVLNNILLRFRKPIAAPSANESGYVSATDAQHVIDSFGKKIDLIINSGRSFYGLESTILDTTSKPFEIKRLGVIDNQKIENLTGIKINPFQFKSKDNNIKPNSPGQMLKHYSPITPLKINVLKPKHNDAFLNFGTKIFIHHKPSLNLSKKSNLDEAAYNLFDYLRKLDKLNKSRIAVAPIPNKGIGKTINERLHRASI